MCYRKSYESKVLPKTFGGTKHMGMSASQMRYVMITGKQNDVEYQGQQINQQRTTLATESSAYNTQLLTLTVPTPPSSDDYVKTNYSFASNGETRTITGTQYQAKDYIVDGVTYPAGSYIVNYTSNIITSQGESSGSSTFSSTTFNGNTTYATTAGTVLTAAVTKENQSGYSAVDANNILLICQDCGISAYKTSGGVGLKSINTDASSTNYNSTDIANLKGIYGTGYDSNATYFKYSSGSGATAKTYYIAATSINSSGASTAYTPDSSSSTGYTGVSETFTPETFYKYTSNGVTKYIQGSQLEKYSNTTSAIATYDVNDNANVTKNAKLLGATVQWNESGRMTSVTDNNNNSYNLTVASTNDDKAYNDAMNEYAFKKSEYEQEMNNINAKIDIIQQEDKKLELKLTDLDTQQKALSNELEAVKKVVDKNVETTFKTFA